MNRMKRLKMFAAHGLLACLLCAAAMPQMACGAHEERPGVQYVLLLDMSGSISAEQRAEWMEKIELLLSKAFNAGDAILALGVHSQTANAAPIYQAYTEPLPANPVAADLQRWKREAKSLRKDGVTAIRQALENACPSRNTDIFSAIDRCRFDSSNRQTVLIFLSDMLNSTGEFDMEKTTVGDDIADHLTRIAGNHAWSNGQLQAVKVCCLLNSIERGESTQLNNRRELEAFWDTLFTTLGADLVLFETHLPDLKHLPWKEYTS